MIRHVKSLIIIKVHNILTDSCLILNNIWPVEPFETVMVVMGCTNKIELN